MSDCGYIYVRNWRKYQHGTAGLPWHKVYGALLHDDAYCELTLAQRGLLHGIWMLTSLTGNGRVSYSQRTLSRQLGCNRVLLEPLIQAGWIEISLDKADRKSRTEEEVDRERDIEHPLPPQGGNGFHPELPTRLTREQREELERRQKRQGAVHKAAFLYHQALDEGDTPERARDWLLNEYRHDPSIVDEAIGAP